MPEGHAVASRSPGVGTSLRTKLLILLLAFGVLPLSTVIVIGYAVSRVTILDQAQGALGSIAAVQAVHFTAELSRERLLLRTIAGQLPDRGVMSVMPPPQLAEVLFRSLPENGVFDGLRLTTADGRVLASVALRQTAPHWPPLAPATNWDSALVMVHRDQNQVQAYLVATRVSGDPRIWLEGHVREADFRRIFSTPEHLLPGAESAVFQRDRRPVFGAHDHAAAELAALVDRLSLDSAGVGRSQGGSGALISVAPIPGSDWSLVAVLPVAFAVAPLSRLRDAAIFGAVVLVLVITTTGMVASRSVTNPLRSLAVATRLLGRDERSPPVPVHSTDEVGTLIASFNTMAENLDRSRQEVAQLHSREMERAQQLATVGELASGVAHEIRNPLTGVRGAIELALRKIPEGDDARTLLMEAQRQLARIESTTTQLLRYARPPDLKEITVDANLLVDRAAAIVAPRAATARVDLTVESSPIPVTVSVDPELMVQVLVNLLLNGIEAMTPGGLLTIWVASHAPDVWIGVRDTGVGVAAKHQDEIFRPFFSTKHQGTGLGLPISKDIVTRHGGTLRLEGSPGGGAAFVVTLPLIETG